jgi:hypothetical protein
MAIRSLAVISFALIAASTGTTMQLHAGETVVDNANGFTLKLPDGFKSNRILAAMAPGMIHAFVLGDPADEETRILLFIEKMGGVLGRERLKPESMPPGFQGRLFTTKWQGFVVDAFEVPERSGELRTITYNVQIPLKRAAIQIKLGGPASREAELQRLLDQILEGLQGESNWLPSLAEGSSLAASENYKYVLIGGAVLVFLIGLVGLYLISRIAPKGIVLMLAILIFVASLAFEGNRTRELITLRFALAFLGIAGGILGLLDLFSKRKKAKPKPPSDNSTQ